MLNQFNFSTLLLNEDFLKVGALMVGVFSLMLGFEYVMKLIDEDDAVRRRGRSSEYKEARDFDREDINGERDYAREKIEDEIFHDAGF